MSYELEILTLVEERTNAPDTADATVVLICTRTGLRYPQALYLCRHLAQMRRVYLHPRWARRVVNPEAHLPKCYQDGDVIVTPGETFRARLKELRAREAAA